MDFTTIKYPSHNELVQWYYQLAQKIADEAGVTPEEVNDLIAAYIDEHPYPVVPSDIITVSNAYENVVTSVNGERGDVTVTGGGDIPDNVITKDNIAQNAVTSFNGVKGNVTGVSSVNGKTGAVTVPVVPNNVITGDNIAKNAVTSFNGDIGAVRGVTSVNGQEGPNVSLAVTRPSDRIEINIGNGMYLVSQNVTMTYGVGGAEGYVGVFPKDGKTAIRLLISAEFTDNPAPFTPSCFMLDLSEGTWTIVIGGLSSGTVPSDGTTKNACITMIVS